jgi:hypothetical protein
VLAGVHQGERHRGRVGQQQRPPAAAYPAEEEDHHEQRECRVQRRHGRHRIRRQLPGVEYVAGAVQPDRLPAPGGDPDDLREQAVLRRPPRRGGRVGEVGDQPEDGQHEPAPRERRPARPVTQPQHDRDAQRGHEMGEVHPAGDDVPPVDAGRVVEALLQPDGGHVTAEQEPVGLDQFDGVRGAALVGQAPGEVVDHEQQHDRQPVPGEAQVHPTRLVDPDGDRGQPQPPERQQRVGERQPEKNPPGDETDGPQGQRDDPLPLYVSVIYRFVGRGGHRHQG